MLKSKVFWTIIVSSVLIFSFADTVSAHVLKSDGPVGAVLHIDPDDNPIIGEEATFFLQFNDRDNEFSLTACQCRFSILKDNQELFSTDLLPTDDDPDIATGFTYTFQEKGIYQVKVDGTPINNASFPSFGLTYDWRIDREAGNSNVSSGFVENNLHFILLGGILIVFLALVLSKRIRKDNPNSQISSKILLLITLLSTTIALHSLQFDHLVFAHHLPTQQEDPQPCCLPQPNSEVQQVNSTETTFNYLETIVRVNPKFVSIVSLNQSTRSPPNG